MFKQDTNSFPVILNDHTRMTYFQPVQIKNSGRPILLNDEHDIMIYDSVGLYLNNQRIKDKQNGRIFLTNKRLIYVDNVSPLICSVSLDLKHIQSLDYQSGFLKRSSRLILFLSPNIKISSPPVSINYTTEWLCPICLMVKLHHIHSSFLYVIIVVFAWIIIWQKMQ